MYPAFKGSKRLIAVRKDDAFTMRTRVTVAIVMGMLVAMVPQTIFAAVPGQEQPPGEQHLIFLVIGVFAVWAAFFAYAFYMARKNIALRRELEDLERELGRRQS